jgi:hypothetical protein
VGRGERFGPDLFDVVTARRLAPHDLPSTVDVACIVDHFALVVDSEHGGTAR